jgi:broad specificity phosphatase PhoE/ribonuclease HI
VTGPATGRRLVVEADGASRGNPGPAAYGAVVRDAATGEVLAEVAEAIGTATNNVAEYRGLIGGLRAAYALDPQAEVEVRMDSKLVVEQMAGRWGIKNAGLRPLAVEARGIYLLADQLTWTWVPRAQNSHADRLANEALDASLRGEIWQPRGRTVPTVDEAEIEPAPPERKLVGWAELGAPTTLLLLRHGETEHTVGKRFSGGRTDPDLSATGLEQAHRAAVYLGQRGGVDAVVSSPLLRARRTAERVAAELGAGVQIEDGFRECDFGEWDGHTFAEVQQRWPDELTAWLTSTAVAPPGGESLDQVGARVQKALDRLIAQHPGRTVLLVAHVTPIKMLVRFALHAPEQSLFHMELAPASLGMIQYWADGTTSLRGFNDTGYLGDAARLDGS